MKWKVGVLLGLSVAAGVLGGCDNLCANLDCDPGGGGGIGNGDFRFSRGVVFVRGGDVYAADETDFSVQEPLTTGGSFQQPSLSPDGRSVVAATRDGSQLVRVSLSGATATLLQAGGSFLSLRAPVFTPDGQSVVFAFDRSGATCIGEVAADGSGGAQALLGCSSTSPSVYTSPSFDKQGRLLVGAGSFNNITSLELWNLSTRTKSTVSLGTLRLANRAVLSPDGTKVAFDATSSSSTASGLYFVSTSGGTPVQLQVGAGNHTYPSWVGNSALVFSSSSGGADAVYRVSLNSGSAELAVPSGVQPFYGPN